MGFNVSTVPGRALTRREDEIVALLAEGYNYQQAAEELGIAASTAFQYVRQARTKMGARNGCHLVALWIRSGR